MEQECEKSKYKDYAPDFHEYSQGAKNSTNLNLKVEMYMVDL